MQEITTGRKSIAYTSFKNSDENETHFKLILDRKPLVRTLSSSNAQSHMIIALCWPRFSFLEIKQISQETSSQSRAYATHGALAFWK